MNGIFFDLDDTLMVDEAVGREAMLLTGDLAAQSHGADGRRFARTAEALAAKEFAGGPFAGYCDTMGINATECLWGRFVGESEVTRGLRAWAMDFRERVFEGALREQLLEPQNDAEQLVEEFGSQRRKLQRLLPDTVETLMRLRKTHSLGLITNGDSDLQREKLAASGLGGLFGKVLVSGELGIGKPNPAIFQMACEEPAVMVGNSLKRDVAGAKAVGWVAVWLRVPGAEEFAEVTPDFTIDGLHELPVLVSGLAN